MAVYCDIAVAIVLRIVVDNYPLGVAKQSAELVRPESMFVCKLLGHSDNVKQVVDDYAELKQMPNARLLLVTHSTLVVSRWVLDLAE